MNYVSILDEIQIKKKKCITNKNKNKILILLIIISITFYIFSLCHIKALDMKCYNKKGVECFYLLATLTFISSIFISIVIYCIFYKNYTKIYLIYIILIYLLIFYLDHDDGLVKHGFFNILLFIISTLVLTIILNFIHYLFYLLKKKKL